jgi:hypothetical protein
MEYWNGGIMKELLVEHFPNILLFQYSIGDFHPIPPRMLGPVQGGIGALDAVVNALFVCIAGYPKADGQGKPFFFSAETGLSNLKTNFLGHRYSAFQIGIGEQNEEFLSPPTGQQVLAPQVFPYALSYGYQDPITLGVSAGVINLFEMVDVPH